MSVTIGGILTALQIGSELLGLISEDTPSQQVNPLTDDFYAQLQNALATQQQQQVSANLRANRVADRLGSLSSQQQRTAGEIGNLQGPDANAFFDQWLQNIPEYQNIAQQTADQATTQLGRNIQEQGQLQTQQALDAVAQKFAGQGFSGAAAQAAGQAASGIAGQNQANLSNQFAQILGNTFNQQAGLGQNLAMQGQQNKFMNSLNALSQQLAGQQSAAGTLGAQGSIYNNQANQASNMLANIYGQLGGISDPVYTKPTTQNTGADLTAILNSMFNLANEQWGGNVIGGTDSPNYNSDLRFTQ